MSDSGRLEEQWQKLLLLFRALIKLSDDGYVDLLMAVIMLCMIIDTIIMVIEKPGRKKMRLSSAQLLRNPLALSKKPSTRRTSIKYPTGPLGDVSTQPGITATDQPA